jgi:hypothetical protein
MLQRMLLMPAWRTRLLISAGIGVGTGIFCWVMMTRLGIGAGDFTWAILAARDLLAGHNPYARPLQLYPLPTALFGLPFNAVKPEIAAGVFYGASSALLALGVTRHGYHRLLIFLAYPYWAGILTAQWIPLIMASTFFPLLLPATLAKPQIGLPVALTHITRRGAAICLGVVLLSFLVMPRWIPLWVAQLGGYSRFTPLLVLPGPILAAALLRYRDRDAWLLFLAACMPQRWFYDPFFLWLIPKTRRSIVFTAGVSWIPGIWRWYHDPRSFTEVGRWIVLWFYCPMLVVLLLRRFPSRNQGASEAVDETSSMELNGEA